MFDKLASDNVLEETIKNLESRGIKVLLTENKSEALERLKELIPAGSEVMNGSSTTLNEIGYTDYLKTQKEWVNLHEKIFAEKDAQKQADLRRKAETAEYFLGSVNAISTEGELISCDRSGSRVGAYLFAAKNLVLVSGTNKVVRNLEEGIKRVREYVLPKESERAMKAYGVASSTNKWAIIEREFPGRITLILVKEKLGF